MADERVVSYIMDCLGKGYDTGYVIETLTQQGWTRQEISDAIDVVQGRGRQYRDQPPRPQMQPEYARTDRTENAAEMRPAQQPGWNQGMQPQPQQAQSQQAPPRPKGVVLISVLGFLSAAFLIISGIFVVFFSMLFGALLGAVGEEGATAAGIFASLGNMIALFLFILGIIELVAFYMLLKMKRKGFMLVTILMALQTGLGGITMNVPVVIPSVIVLIYILMKRDLFVR